MKFWGTEVRPGQTISCIVDNEHFIHISQAALGKTKKGSEKVVVSVKVDGTKVVIGTLSAENHPHFSCDLIFEKEFELSHSSKTASVFLSGYKAAIPDPFESSSDEEEDEEEPKKLTAVNLISDKSKGKSTVNTDKKDKDKDESDEDDSDESDDLQFSSSSDDMTEDESSSDEDATDEDATSSEEDESSNEDYDTSSEEDVPSSEEDESDEEDVVIPQTENDKKRVVETALKTPPSNKKAKIAAPSDQKTGDKKVIHVATPHPAKQASKTANGKSKEKSPKSTGGSHVCKPCNRTFGSDSALQSHEKAKHKGAASGDM